MRYDTPRWNGISGSYARVFGNTAGDADRSSADIYALRYDNNGRFYGAVGNYKANNSSGNAAGETTWGGVGARVTKDLTLTASYFDLKNPSNQSGTNGHFAIQTVGARYALTPKVELNGAVYQLKDKNNSANGANLQSTQVTYSFSRRTQVYAAASMIQNKGATGISAFGAGGSNLNSLGTSNALATAGADQTAYAVGLRHSF
jgi:predicted porin